MIRIGHFCLGAVVTALATSFGCLFSPVDYSVTGGQGGTSTTMASTSAGGAGGSHPCSPTAPCTDESAKVCDGSGICVECAAADDCEMGLTPSCDVVNHTCISCSDGKQNGDETGIDCGGACPNCNGATCGTPADCRSMVCADGVCCDKDCSTSCNACAVPGKVGECTPVTKGFEDVGCAGPGKACNGDGVCADPASKKKVGESCSNDGECYAGACNGMCRLPEFAPCAENAECSSLRCVANVCTGCSMNSDCVSKICSMASSRCLIPDGGVCLSDSECSGSVCNSTRRLCGQALGAQCANGSDCATRYCNAMDKCAPCSPATQAADCAGQTCDPTGNCRLPTGAPCTASTQCTSNKCSTTFPAKCQ